MTPFQRGAPISGRYQSHSPKEIAQMIMTEFLLQQALNDEWQRVFFDEKRVGLGVFVVVIYCIGKVLF